MLLQTTPGPTRENRVAGGSRRRAARDFFIGASSIGAGRYFFFFRAFSNAAFLSGQNARSCGSTVSPSSWACT